MKDYADNEKAVIGMLLVDPEYAIPIAKQAGLAPDWFTDDTWAVFWMAMDNLFKLGRAAADPLAVLAEVRRLAETPEVQKNFSPRADISIADEAITAAPATTHLDHHLALLREGHLARAILRANHAFSKRLNSGIAPADAAVRLKADLDAILAGEASAKKIPLRAITAEIMKEYETAHHHRIVEKDLAWTPGHRFPWSPMTAMMNGLEPGLGIIAARPSVGKTLFALNLIRFWCDTGVHVCFCSLDMEQRSLIRRFISERARVSIKKARFSPTGADLAAMRDAIKEIDAWPLDYVEIRDVDEFAAHVQIERAAGHAQIVVVDYLGLMHSAKIDNAREYDRVSYVSDRLKALANSERIPVIALAQLNREVTKSEDGRLPTLADLRGSGSIEQDAFWVAFLHRDERVVNGTWKTNPPYQLVPEGAKYPATMNALDSIHFVLAKSQNGELGSLPFVFRKNYLTCALGDWKAAPEQTQTGYGATARTVLDHTPRFSKVCSDWRHDPLEKFLAAQDALIRLPESVDVGGEAPTPAAPAVAPAAPAGNAGNSARELARELDDPADLAELFD